MTTFAQKRRAVLAHAPAFSLEAALALGGLQRDPRDFLLALFGGVEAREMLADDLVGLIALEPARAGVPARDPALRSSM